MEEHDDSFQDITNFGSYKDHSFELAGASPNKEMTVSSAIDIPTSNGANDDGNLHHSEHDFCHSYALIPSLPPPSIFANHSNRNSDVNMGPSVESISNDLQLVAGEKIEAKQKFENRIVVLTNFRICVFSIDSSDYAVIPLVTVDAVDSKDQVKLSICCKDGRIIWLTAETVETSLEWYKKLTGIPSARDGPRHCFAYTFAQELRRQCSNSGSWLLNKNTDDYGEYERLEFNAERFRISNVNQSLDLCETYPRRVIVPKEMTDDDLKNAAKHRALNRLPAVVWRCKETNAIMMRSSQPSCGLFWWRNEHDEKILELSSKAAQTNPSGMEKLAIIDARSYSAAFANRAKGGGFESTEHYKNTEILFMGLANIHHVRYSFVQLRNLLNDNTTISFLRDLEATNWYNYLLGLFNACLKCVDLLYEGRSVLVHCSDGWDRTTQIVALTKLIADPYYRTLEGFRVLIQTDWLSFGHKFADRQGAVGKDSYERSPVFLQFLDCVYQLMFQNKTVFEFNLNYLMKLALHSYSGLFGTFLHNSQKDSEAACNNGEYRTISIWQYLHKDNEEVVNLLYKELPGRLPFNASVKHFQLWRELYLRNNDTLKNGGCEQPVTVPVAETDRLSLHRASSTDSLQQRILADSTHTSPTNGRTNLNDSFDVCPMVDSSQPPLINRNSTTFNSSSHTVNTKDIFDDDGLVKFHDHEQEQVRKLKEEHRKEMLDHSREKERRRSERISGSSSSYKNSLHTNDESEESEYENVDHVTSVQTSSKYWEMQCNNKKCALCGALIVKFSKHHCRACGREVCDACSQKRYHETNNGVGQQQRCCDACYKKMEGTGDDTPLTRSMRASPQLNTPSPIPSTCGESHEDRNSKPLSSTPVRG